MPTQVDHSRPVRTLDTHGNVISTDTNHSAPIKHVDSVGREVAAEAAKVAEQAASANPAIPKPANDNGEKPSEPTQAQIRKEYLEAQKEKRKAFEMLKTAREKIARADAIDKARALAESGEDPTAILKAAGLDEVDHYRKMTQYALSDKAKKPEDPVQKELREHKERLDEYSKRNEELAKQIKDKEDLAAHNQVITEKVVPMLQADPDKYEALLAEYGPNAAVEVYQTVWDIYQKTGKARSFTEVADEMEAYWSETIDKGIQAAAKLKKFQNRFSQAAPEPRQTPDRIETPRRSVTLSNKPSAPAPIAEPAFRKKLTRDERVAEILRRHSG